MPWCIPSEMKVDSHIKAFLQMFSKNIIAKI